MDMITVLDTISAVEGNDIGVFLIVSGIVLFFLGLFIGIMTTNPEIFLLGTGIGALVLCIGVAVGYNAPEKYKCTVNDGVDAKQFIETFVVEKQEGLIYTVYLKADEK